MSDDLVKRLREYAQVAHMAAAWGFAGEGYTMEKAADRIEELEAERAKQEALMAAGFAEYERRLAKAVEALEFIAYYECVGDASRCGSKAALAELTGGKDE